MTVSILTFAAIKALRHIVKKNRLELSDVHKLIRETADENLSLQILKFYTYYSDGDYGYGMFNRTLGFADMLDR